MGHAECERARKRLASHPQSRPIQTAALMHGDKHNGPAPGGGEDARPEVMRVDAVLASDLARAIQTAALIYGSERNGPVHVVPFIREANPFGLFANNAPVSAEAQRQRLNATTYPDNAGVVDYTYMEGLEGRESDWDMFKRFLAERVLPDLAKVDDRGGRELTIAVVTHSYFIAHTELGKHCKHHYKGLSKPRNTQTFQVEFTWRGRRDSPLKLLDTFACEHLHPGSTWGISKATQLCSSDIGDDCITDWENFSKKGMGFIKKAQAYDKAKHHACLAKED